ncbi:hypothetical protein [Micromonospora sp. NPDC004551]|uniref:hypothetical protein n=1 Tax=Micromonospora sp. NPDC004551 TaxID=3154284 RepID=UPI0033AD19A3
MTHHDDATWRAIAAGRPGYATYRDTKPGNPNPWRQPTLDGPPRPARPLTWRPPRLDTFGLPRLPEPEIPDLLPPAAAHLVDAVTTWRGLGEMIARVEMHPAAWQVLHDSHADPRPPDRPTGRDQLAGVPVTVNPDLPVGGWRAISTGGVVLSQGHIRPTGPDPLRSPQTPPPAAPTPTPTPEPDDAPSDATPAAPPASTPMATGPDEGGQGTGRRRLDPGSPWRWLRAISPF